MNESGKDGSSRAEAVPSQVVVIGSNGMLWGPFDDGAAATAWAKAKWPDQKQDDTTAYQTQGWDIATLFTP